MNSFWRLLIYLSVGASVTLMVIELATNDSAISNKLRSGRILIAEQNLEVEIVATPQQQIKGLADRADELTDDQGMIFIYNEPIIPAFWMKGMNFPLDIIWIDNGQVVGWEANVPADNGATIYSPLQPVNQVLEVSAGWVDRNNLTLGSPVSDVIE